MFTLYIANKNYSSWSLRPWLTLTQLGVAFDEVVVPFRADPRDTQAAFSAFSPTGKVPCLVDGSTVVWDSLAITEYVAEKHPGVWPAEMRARAFARCAAAEMHSGFGALRSQCSMSCGVRVRLDSIDEALRADLERLQALWSEGLARFGGPFLAGGAFSAADAFFAPVAFRVQTYGLPLGDPARGYAERLLELPGMRTWYAAALAEPWRDDAHDREVLARGTLIADLRRA